MERSEGPSSQPPPEVPQMVAGHRACDADRDRAEEFRSAGGGEHAGGQQDQTSWKGKAVASIAAETAMHAYEYSASQPKTRSILASYPRV